VERERGGKIGLDAPFEYFRYKRQPRFDHAALLKWFESTRVSAGAGGRGPLRYRDSPAKKSAYFLVNGRALTGADAGLSTGHSPTALLQALYTTKSVNWLRGRRSIRSLRAGLPATRLRAESSQQRRSKSPQYKRAPSALPPGYRSRLPSQASPVLLRHDTPGAAAEAAVATIRGPGDEFVGLAAALVFAAGIASPFLVQVYRLSLDASLRNASRSSGEAGGQLPQVFGLCACGLHEVGRRSSQSKIMRCLAPEPGVFIR
jgi:hypothetical protein